jgi:hypothetical protein
MNELATYEERIVGQKMDSLSAGADRICKLQDKIDDARDDIESGFVVVVNSMRAQGLELLRMSDREQITFRFFSPLKDAMPFDFETAKSRIALAKKLEKPVKTFDEAREVYRSVLEQMNLLQIDHIEGNRGVAHDPFSIALNSFVLLKQKFQKAMTLTPLDKCGQDRLKSIVADTQWAVELNAQARAELQR